LTLKLIGALICWFIAFIFFTLGVVVVKSEKRKQDTIIDFKLKDLEASADSFLAWVIFFVVNSIGAFLSALPWWVVKLIYILLGIGFLLLGVKCMGWFH
jgi:hypothetical protein